MAALGVNAQIAAESTVTGHTKPVATTSDPIVVTVAQASDPGPSTAQCPVHPMLAHVPASAREQAIADAQLRYTVRRYPRHQIRSMYHAQANALYASHPRYRPVSRHGLRREHYMPHTLVKPEASREASTTTVSDGMSVKNSFNNPGRGISVMGENREDISGLMPEPRVAIERAGREMHEAEIARQYAKKHRHGSIEMRHAQLRHKAAVKEFNRLIRLDRAIEGAMAYEIGHHLRKDWEKRDKHWHLTGSAKLPDEQHDDQLGAWWYDQNSSHTSSHHHGYNDYQKYLEHIKSHERRERLEKLNNGQVIERDFEHESRTFDEHGFDRYGYNKFGFNKDGFNRNGLNIDRFDTDGRLYSDQNPHPDHCVICIALQELEDQNPIHHSPVESLTVGGSTAVPTIVGANSGANPRLATYTTSNAATIGSSQPEVIIIKPHHELHQGAREVMGDPRIDYACHHRQCHATSEGYLGMLMFNFIRRGELHMTASERLKARLRGRRDGDVAYDTALQGSVELRE